MKNLARVYSAELDGVNARLIEVEVDLNVGLHSFNIVGLADKALNEARERVNSALKNSQVKPPNRENRRITINLAPADVQKTGTQYDLALALGYLLATKQMKDFDPTDKIFVGELALDGRLRRINGALNIAQMAVACGFTSLYLPVQNAREAAAIINLKIIPVATLEETIQVLEGRREAKLAVFELKKKKTFVGQDLSEIKGQAQAKRALMIAAAGGHNLLMIGPPGVGKSLLAQALLGILPDLTLPEAIEVTKIWSAAGLTPNELIQTRPFRGPHHTASLVAVVGGGPHPKPGEISLAHRGILFLDELPEFPRSTLEALRQPLEDGRVKISRAHGTLIFPARFTLIAAMNPCPCGLAGDPEQTCRCSAHEVLRYQKKISGPLLDRIDLQIKVPRVQVSELQRRRASPESDLVKRQVERARVQARARLKSHGLQSNAEMTNQHLEKILNLEPETEEFLASLEEHKISPRTYYRLLKVGRTIADLEESATVAVRHLAEAFSYRLRGEYLS